MTTQQNYDEVICPACVHQFRAIPVNVQEELRRQHQKIVELEAQLVEASRDAAAWREHVEQAKVSYAAFVNGLNKEQP